MRQLKPFYRRQTRSWYVQIGRRQINNLGRDRKLAWRQDHELMAREQEIEKQAATVAELFDLYLDWCQQRRARGTYEKTRHYLRSFIDSVGKRLSVSLLRPFHITDWLLTHPTWTSTTQHDGVSALSVRSIGASNRAA